MRIAHLVAGALVAAALLAPRPLQAQEPGDTVPRPDSVSAQVPDPEPDDNLRALPDSLRYRTLAGLHPGAPAGFHTGVWEWDRAELISARAQTVLELLETLPGVVSLRGGDYGTPEIVTTFGLGGGRVRVFLDGFEMLPLDGSVPDLARVLLAGVQRVRVERGMGEVRIELASLRADDPRPMSIVEAGTGDLDTNHFRGTFIHPRALGGSLGLAMERIDTRGPRGREEGSRTGGWLRYTYHLGDRGGIQAEYRKGSVKTALDTFPSDISRTDWSLRARYELSQGLVAEAFTGGSGIEGPDDGLSPIAGDRSQHGVRASLERGPFWARGSARLLTGPELPSSSLEMEAGGSLDDLGGASARLSHESWDGTSASRIVLRAWTRPLYGLSGFASYESGKAGARHFLPRVVVPDPDPEDPEDPENPEDPEDPQEPPPPTHRVTDRTGLRVGASFAWGPVGASAAWLRAETDSLLPFGLHTDREGLALPGGEFTGWELAGHLDLPVDGFRLYGSLQQWEEEARYLPGRVYQGGIAFHDVFLESGNFEVWGDLGVQGRDPMLVPLSSGTDALTEQPILERVPFRQSWNAFIEARILTVHIIIRWDNFTVRRNNQDFPGRVQPRTRATYGIRWTLWN